MGFFHTVIGPDHYLPFIAMEKARGWSILKTIAITFLCGLGHVASSVLLGVIGIILGIGVMRLEMFERVRGNLAGWLLTGFGFAYLVWGLRWAIRNRPHGHLHEHEDAGGHSHTHTHHAEHTHVHDSGDKKNITPWVLFTIFVLGPCEPLIPILMYPAAKKSVRDLVGVTFAFSVTTIATMLAVVVVSSLGVNLLPLGRLERYSHALAGAAIFLCGLAIQFLGL